MKKRLTLVLCTCLAGGSVLAAPDDLRQRRTDRDALAGAARLADEVQASGMVVHKPAPARVDEWLGSSLTVGTTRYDYQANGSTSRMIAVSSDGMVHGSFMGGTDAAAGRRVKAWCADPSDMTMPSPAADPLTIRTGYTTSAVTGPNPGNGLSPNTGVVSMHSGSPAVSWIGTDFGGCTLAFNTFQHTGTNYLWPHVAVDGNDRLHMISYGSDDSDSPKTTFYDASTDGATWDNGTFIELTDNSEGLGAIPVANGHTDRAAVLFFEKTGPEDVPYDGPPEGGEIGIQIHHDVRAYLAENGNLSAEMNAGNELNLTNYGPGSEAPFGPYGCRAYCDLDGVFDMTAGENLHVVFSTDVMFSDTLSVYDGDGDFNDLVHYKWNLDRGQIWHLNVDTGDWSHVAGYNSGNDDEFLFFTRPQAWRMFRDRPQISVDPATGYLYTIWSEYTAADTSAAGYFNGEIMARCSADNGVTWGPAVNLTNSPSPGCASGDCDAEDWPSMAAVAQGGFLHISFVHDLDAGGIPNTPPEGAETLNNMIYLKVPVAEIPPHTGTPWDAAGHVGLVDNVRTTYTFNCVDWVGETAFLDSAHWVEKVHVFNESPFDVRVNDIKFYHHPSDLLGDPEDGGLLELGLEIWQNGSWQPLSQWDGWLPQWRATKFRANVAYSGLPNYDQLLVFHLDGQESLVYRVDYDAIDDPACTGVERLDRNNLAAYEFVDLLDVGVGEIARPGTFALEQNWPNPFNPTTTIAFTLDHAAAASLTVHNLLGETVATLVDGPVQAGRHTVDFDASALASGVYVYTLQTAGLSESRKLVVLK